MAEGPSSLPVSGCTVGVNVIETAALGRPFQLGTMYDCRKDALIPGIRLWSYEKMQQNICAHRQINTNFKVTSSDSIEDKSNLLNIDGSLQLSVLGGLVNVTGSAKYLNDTKKSFNQQRLALHYHSTSKFEELIMNHLAPENIVHHQVFDNDTATHVVTAVLYGADACFVFDREVSSDEDKTTVEGEVKFAFEKLSGIVSAGVNVDLNMDDTQKNVVKKFNCTFYGDFQLPANPTTFEDAVKVFADLPKLLGENKEVAVPVRVWLYPLDKLLSKTVKLQKDISIDLITDIESVIESLRTTEMKCNDLLKDTPAQAFKAFHDKIQNMKQNCYKHKLRLMKKLGSLLPNIRGDMIPDTALNDLLKDHEESPFSGSDLEQWLKERQNESNVIKTLLRQLIDSGAKVEDNLDNILMDLEVENLVSYTFTSLDWSDVLLSKQKAFLSSSTMNKSDENKLESKQKSWLTAGIKKTMKNNLKIFKNLINSKECKPEFIVSSKEMENNPGSCILLYEDGCDEAVCFNPPSKPACPITEEVRDDRVVVKVSSSCPATVEVRLLFKMKEQSVWTSQSVLKDTNTVTVTDLRADTEYQMKCAAVGKLNYTFESDVITVITEGSTSNRAELSAGSSSPAPVMRILLMGRKGSGKSSSGNTILGQRKFKIRMLEAEVCEEITVIGLKQVHVIDPPVLLDPDLSKEKFKRLKEKLLNLCSAGLSAVLLVLPLETKVENEEEILYFIKDILGADVQKYIMVLFTRGDELDDDDTIDTYLTNEDHADLQQLVTECGGRFHCFNNRSKEKDQVTQLLQKIERMAAGNGGKFIMAQMKRRSSKGTPVNFSDEHPKQQIRLVLLGKTGVGKSSTGNTILGRKVFESSGGSNSLTKQCSSETNERIGKEISVIDTPGLYDTELSKDEVIEEMVKCIFFSSPGPHAFLVVIKVGRFTEEEKNTVKQLKEVFGNQMEKYTMIIFTHKDQLKKNETIEEYLQKADPDLQTLIKNCGNRYICMDNNSASFPQFRDLLKKIEMMVAENEGTHEGNGAEKSIQERQKQYRLKHYLFNTTYYSAQVP